MKPNIFQYDRLFELERGESFPSLNIAYHTYGTLNERGDNAIWVCHALTANSEVDSWWPGMIGEGELLDPSRYLIVCANIPGSCYGSTGPSTTNPGSGLPWYRSFPELTVRDLVNAHELLRVHLGIRSIHTVVGGSLGGFQALEYAIMYPDLIRNLVFIAASVEASPWVTAFNQSQRLAIEADPSFSEEKPYGGLEGLKCSRSIALLSYRNSRTYNSTQAERDHNRVRNQAAAGYQDYQGDKLARRFDAYSYHALTRVMDTHNIVRGRGSLSGATERITARVLCIGISSDLLFPVEEQKLLAHITQGQYTEIETEFGHDGFLIETGKVSALIRKFWSEHGADLETLPAKNHLTLEWSKTA